MKFAAPAFCAGLKQEPATDNQDRERNQNHADGKTGLMLVEVRPVIGGQTRGLHGHLRVGGEISSQRWIGRGLRQALARAVHEEPAGGVIASVIALELNWILSERVFHQAEQAASDPWSVDLKLYDEETVRLQQTPGPLQSLTSIDIVIDADVGKVRRSGVR